MSSPYRSSPKPRASSGRRDSGIVGEIVGQFADKLAFYRELVQNAIDADTESISVELHYENSRQALLCSVTDHGSGMSKEIFENQLLVLFRSTKEGDDKRIGKFGIGFVSVLAVRPNLVTVVSCFQGTRHTLHLYPDLSYELFESGVCTKSGTRVELEIPMVPDEVEEFVSASAKALRRWCRHAAPLITFKAIGPAGTQMLSERIDTELSLPGALASVEVRSGDGRMNAFVGIAKEQYSAFFNHGLLLCETREPVVGGLSFVIQDSSLGHTLSRDNVREDQHYDSALGSIREAIPALREEVVRVMKSLLKTNSFTQYRELLSVSERNLNLDAQEIPLPLVEALDGQTWVSVATFRSSKCFVATESSALTRVLSACGVAVVDLTSVAGSSSQTWFYETCPELRYANDELSLVTPIDLSGSDMLLLERLSLLLDGVAREPSEIILAEIAGKRSDFLVVTGSKQDAAFAPSSGIEWILDDEACTRDPFRLLLRPALVLNSGSAEVVAARELAKSELTLAADLLARHILIAYDRLSVDSSEALLCFGLAEYSRGRR